MGKRGAKPKGKVKIKWSANFAYAIGLIASDGCLSSTGRHITLVSKDIDQLENFLQALDIEAKITKHFSGFGNLAWRIQFGDVIFYQFLNSIGLFSKKSKTMKKIGIPKQYFFDFLRGLFDGDGSIHSYFDKRWRSSFMFYLIFASASPIFLSWLRNEIKDHTSCFGHITKTKDKSCLQLKFAKTQALKVISKMYTKNTQIYLSRKKLKIDRILATMLKNKRKYKDTYS